MRLMNCNACNASNESTRRMREIMFGSNWRRELRRMHAVSMSAVSALAAGISGIGVKIP